MGFSVSSLTQSAHSVRQVFFEGGGPEEGWKGKARPDTLLGGVRRERRPGESLL
jgi:hypothetical protein